MKEIQKKVTDAWESLRAFTDARIALGRTGNSIPLQESLQFKLAHAHARDAVYSLLDKKTLVPQLEELKLPVLELHSKAENRQQYLQRPDLGRSLNEPSGQIIKDHASPCDISIIIADGLSALAVNRNAVPLIRVLLPLLQSMKYSFSPICLAEQARVAIGDPVGLGLQSKLSIVLIGERPGLSSWDSLGVYITYQPRPGLTDDSRNCISNIREQGLQLEPAAEKIFYLVQEALRRKLSGISLKDESRLL